MIGGFKNYEEKLRKPISGRKTNKNCANILRVGKSLATFTAQDIYDALIMNGSSASVKSRKVTQPISRMIESGEIIRIRKGVYRLRGNV